MFVSSYNTYIPNKHTSQIDKHTQNARDTFSQEQEKLFSKNLEKVVASSVKIPLNYISNYKSLHNQQLLQQQNAFKKEYAKTKFEKINKISSAQNAYSENSHYFSLLQKPKTALTQEVKQPENIQQNTLLKQKFINTYIANDNYYRVTAA
ncbi:hypothetical protein FJR45_03325 [Sulfurimonas sediminis]|uniref:Uncharacterized protein n=1 Tax=Sulfurimonas sediminis TaxID=2590020 RepID=A0A7M1B001_9BACT|nr:hypothetical protein [Sulfurimonas sediminis]QOP43034.1 hypothetical protein FJR45_03325 [Sulfurimonas sediminis]